MVRVMVQVFQQMHCVKPEQDNFTYYPVNHVSVPTLARENCRWCKILDSEENIYEPVIFPGEDTTARIVPVEEKAEETSVREKLWTAGEVREVEGGGRREEFTREWRGRSEERSWRGRSATREKEVEKPDEGYDSTGEPRGRRRSRRRARDSSRREKLHKEEVWSDVDDWRGRLASPKRTQEKQAKSKGFQ